jgi:hypothetical protein
VNDIACGIGYGATMLKHTRYVGYDQPGIPEKYFGETFVECDINDKSWLPYFTDVTICFETLEHVDHPDHLAKVICATTQRAIFVSVPIVPTVGTNPYHTHDFTESDIPPMFAEFRVKDMWAQPEEVSHVWYLERTS